MDPDDCAPSPDIRVIFPPSELELEPPKRPTEPTPDADLPPDTLTEPLLISPEPDDMRISPETSPEVAEKMWTVPLSPIRADPEERTISPPELLSDVPASMATKPPFD
jgi:hypothetical protein